MSLICCLRVEERRRRVFPLPDRLSLYYYTIHFNIFMIQVCIFNGLKEFFTHPPFLFCLLSHLLFVFRSPFLYYIILFPVVVVPGGFSLSLFCPLSPLVSHYSFLLFRVRISVRKVFPPLSVYARRSRSLLAFSSLRDKPKPFIFLFPPINLPLS